MVSDRPTPSVGPILRFQPDPPSIPQDGVATVVLDTAWTSPPDLAGHGVIGLRDVAARVLGPWDLLAETARRLDDWAADSGVVEALTIERTSFWFQARVAHGTWLQERLLWLGLVDAVVREVGPSRIECAPGCDAQLVAAVLLVAERDGLPIELADAPASMTDPFSDDALATHDPTASPGVAAHRPSPVRRLARRIARVVRPAPPPDEVVRRRQAMASRLDGLTSQPGRLLVVMVHALQQVETPAGRRRMNVYLGPIVDRLRGSALDPIEVEARARVADDEVWKRLSEPASGRVLSGDVIRDAASGENLVALRAWATTVATSIASSPTPMVVNGLDLGPSVAVRVADHVRSSLAGQALAVTRLRMLIGRLRPSLILMADEYHRQDWLTAARLEGVPTVAIQHGMIYRWHNGYMHCDRPDQLALAGRTYVFGEWERRLLVEQSVYREDEVRVGGSPRLDLAVPQPATERDQVRAELGVATGDRLVVVSGTWGQVYRQFHYPIALANLVDRPLPRVHLVVKLHPSERDEGPYRAVIDGVAAAHGFEPPPVSVVQSVDLYRLLRAADAHIGLQSTVLTEAVVTGTLNLLAVTSPASDLLGYVEAGVAIPVRTGGDLLAALDAGPAAAASPEARQDFMDAHFQPGSASERIAEELLAWPA